MPSFLYKNFVFQIFCVFKKTLTILKTCKKKLFEKDFAGFLLKNPNNPKDIKFVVGEKSLYKEYWTGLLNLALKRGFCGSLPEKQSLFENTC